jgi:hypothetical protein
MAYDTGGQQCAAETVKSVVTVKKTGVWRIHALFVGVTTRCLAHTTLLNELSTFACTRQEAVATYHTYEQERNSHLSTGLWADSNSDSDLDIDFRRQSRPTLIHYFEIVNQLWTEVVWCQLSNLP